MMLMKQKKKKGLTDFANTNEETTNKFSLNGGEFKNVFESSSAETGCGFK